MTSFSITPSSFEFKSEQALSPVAILRIFSLVSGRRTIRSSKDQKQPIYPVKTHTASQVHSDHSVSLDRMEWEPILDPVDELVNVFENLSL